MIISTSVGWDVNRGAGAEVDRGIYGEVYLSEVESVSRLVALLVYLFSWVLVLDFVEALVMNYIVLLMMK